MTDTNESVDEFEQLEEAARERWGEDWTISITRWSDGTTDAYAFRSRGEVRRDDPEQYVERERLRPTDDGFVYERVIVRDQAVVDVLERDGPGN